MSNVRGAVHRAVEAVAQRELGRMGLVRQGDTNLWVDDHDWWLINVELVPSEFVEDNRMYVGEQHLWIVCDEFCFEQLEPPLHCSIFTHHDDRTLASALEALVQATTTAIERRREAHGEGINVSKRLAAVGDDLTAGIAWALLGEQVADTTASSVASPIRTRNKARHSSD